MIKRHRVCFSEKTLEESFFSTTGSEFYIHCIYSLIKTPGGIIFSTAGFEFLYALYLFFSSFFLAKKENVKKKGVCQVHKIIS